MPFQSDLFANDNAPAAADCGDCGRTVGHHCGSIPACDQAPAEAGCLGCGASHPGETLVTLVNGHQVSNYSEAWRLECEARGLLARPLDVRRDRLKMIERKRGAAAADQLRDVMADIWNRREAAKRANMAA